MNKVFWQFPTPDNTTQWDRLDKTVQKQVMWLNNPRPLVENVEINKDNIEDFKKEASNYSETTLNKDQISLAKKQYEFALQYNLENKQDLNYSLTTYVDINYQEIWCDEFMKAKKGEIK